MRQQTDRGKINTEVKHFHTSTLNSVETKFRTDHKSTARRFCKL